MMSQQDWEDGIAWAMACSQEILQRSGVKLDREEFAGNVGLTYWESLCAYPAHEGCCDWAAYFELQIENLIREMSRRRSRRIRLESSLSLDQPREPSRRPAEEWIRRPQGDFTNGVAFRDNLSRLEGKKFQLAKRYCNQETDAEILAHTHMKPNELIQLKQDLQVDMLRYLNI